MGRVRYVLVTENHTSGTHERGHIWRLCVIDPDIDRTPQALDRETENGTERPIIYCYSVRVAARALTGSVAGM